MRQRLLVVALCLLAAPPHCKRRKPEGPPPPPITSLDACDARGDSPVEVGLSRAEDELRMGNTEAVKAAVANARQQAGGDAFLLLRAGSLLARLGDKKGATEVYEEAAAAAKRIPEPRIAKLYEAAATVRLGDVKAGEALVDGVKGLPGALATYACRYIAAAQAIAEGGDATYSIALLSSVRDAAPKARSVHNALVEIAVRSGDEPAIESAFTAAIAQLPEAPEFPVRRINRLKLAGRYDDALAESSRVLLSGNTDHAVIGEIMGLLTNESVARKAEPKLLALAGQHPELPSLALAVGALYHGMGKPARSGEWLKKCGTYIDREPRVALYLAMNERALHHDKEAGEYIERAAKVAPDDPAVIRLRAVIELVRDPAAAARDLRRYAQMVSGRPDARHEGHEDAAEMEQTIALLERCAQGVNALGCVDHDIVRNGMALALREEYPGIHPDLPDGGTPPDGGTRPDGGDHRLGPSGNSGF